MELPNKKYNIIYSDPAWNYKGHKQHNNKESNKSVENHYTTTTLKDMKNININSISDDDCLLFMWSSSPHLNQAIELGEAWGFKYITIGFVWDKQKVNPSYYTMSQVEICLIFKKGKIPQPRGTRNTRQFLSEMRGKHSKKPDEIRNRITEMFPSQSKIELFARDKYEGWDFWGNEIENKC